MSTTTQLLRRVDALNAQPGGQALMQEPVRPRIKALVDAGLLKSSRMLCRPLSLPTGEVWLRRDIRRPQAAGQLT